MRQRSCLALCVPALVALTGSVRVAGAQYATWGYVGASAPVCESAHYWYAVAATAAACSPVAGIAGGYSATGQYGRMTIATSMAGGSSTSQPNSVLAASVFDDILRWNNPSVAFVALDVAMSGWTSMVNAWAPTTGVVSQGSFAVSLHPDAVTGDYWVNMIDGVGYGSHYNPTGTASTVNYSDVRRSMVSTASYGNALNVHFSLSMTQSLQTGPLEGGGASSASATSAFVADITGLHFFDAAGIELSGVEYSFDRGTTLAEGPLAAPEPATLLLTASGLLALATLRRRSKD